MLLQHGAQLGRDALWQLDRHAGSDSDDVHMFDGPELGQQPVDVGIAQGEGIAAGQKDIPDFGVGGNVSDCLAQFLLAHHEVGLAHHALAQTIAAVDGALTRHTESHPVLVVVDQVLDGRVGHFLQWIFHAYEVRFQFAGQRDDLPAHRARRIIRIHQRCVVGRDGPLENAFGAFNAGLFVGRRIQPRPQRIRTANSMAHVPTPVGPLVGGWLQQGVGRDH